MRRVMINRRRRVRRRRPMRMRSWLRSSTNKDGKVTKGGRGGQGQGRIGWGC